MPKGRHGGSIRKADSSQYLMQPRCQNGRSDCLSGPEHDTPLFHVANTSHRSARETRDKVPRMVSFDSEHAVKSRIIRYRVGPPSVPWRSAAADPPVSNEPNRRAFSLDGGGVFAGSNRNHVQFVNIDRPKILIRLAGLFLCSREIETIALG